MTTAVQAPPDEPEQLKSQRWELLDHVTALTDTLMTALGLVWLWLLILDLTRGLGPWLEALSLVIWGLFGLDFLVKFAIAPQKLAYLRRNWLTALALLLPAFRALRVVRAFRVLRAARAARSVGLLRVVTSLNRGMSALSAWLGRRGLGYVIALTLLVTFGGAAGMYQFENPAALRQSGYAPGPEGAGLASYGEAVWWTAMIMTTMGSQYWPMTAEGRILCLLLALYAFAIFGYITATIASLFVAQDTSGEPIPRSAVAAELAALRREVAALRLQVEPGGAPAPETGSGARPPGATGPGPGPLRPG